MLEDNRQLSSSIPRLKYVPSIERQQQGEGIENSEYRKTYSNYSNIDWSYEYHLEYLDSARPSNYKRIFHDNSKLIVLILTGLTIGPVAIVIDVLSRYLNDMKQGICVKQDHSIFLSRVQCGEENWKSWSNLIFKFVKNDDSMFHYLNNYLIFVIFSVLFAYLTTLLVKRQPFTKYSGISELKIILSGFILNNFLTLQILFTKSIGLILIIGSGIWVGKEGPVVHVAACIAHAISQLFPAIKNNEALQREILTASTAAGIGVAFNAPIGGVLFCLEQVRTYFPVDRLMWNSFVCATISVMILESLHPFSELIYDQIFQVTNHSQNWVRYEIVPFMLLGVIGGYLGIVFNKLNYKFAEARNILINNSIRSKILEVVALSLITAIITYPFIITKTPLTELITVLFSDCNNRDEENSSLILSSLCYATDKFPWKVILLLLLASIQGFALAAYSFGTFIPAGILLPALAIGAIIGRLLGTLIEFFQFKLPNSALFQSCSVDPDNCITPGSYAVVGAASFLTSVTRMSVSVVVILFELTGALNYVIPIMIGVLISRFVADLYSDKSCYELWLQLQNYPYLRPGLDEEINKPLLSMFTCEDFLKPFEELVVVYDEELSIQGLNNLVQDYSFEGFPVVNNRHDNHLLGWCSRHELQLLLFEFEGYTGPVSFQIGGVMNKILSKTDYFLISPHMPILTVYGMFDKLSLKLLIFCYPSKRLPLRSLMTKKDLIEIVEMGDEQLMGINSNFQNNNVISVIEEENGLLNSYSGSQLDEFIIDDEPDEITR